MPKAPSSTGWRHRFAIATIVAVALWGGMKLPAELKRRESLDSAINHTLRAFNERNARQVSRYASDLEMSDFGLTEKEVEKLYVEYVWPSLRGFELLGQPQRHPLEDGTGILAVSEWKRNDGFTVTVPIHSFQTEVGPYSWTIAPIIPVCFIMKYGPKYADKPVKERDVLAVYEGIRRDAGTLERLGVKGSTSGIVGEKLRPWAKLADQYWKLILRENLSASVPKDLVVGDSTPR